MELGPKSGSPRKPPAFADPAGHPPSHNSLVFWLESTKSHTSKPVAKAVTAGLIFAGSDLLEFMAAHGALLLGGHVSMS